MSKQTELTIIEYQSVPFYGGQIRAVRMSNSTIYVAIKPICEHLGISWPSQYNRIKRDPVLSKKTMSVFITKTDIDPSSRKPHRSKMLALPLHYIQGWLFGINANRVDPTIREALIRYQEKCYTVLAEAFSADNSQIGRLWTLYKKAGRSDDWIVRRLQSRRTRDELEQEWYDRGVKSGQEFALLTDEVSKETFELTTREYKELKQLENNVLLRDHMTGLELAFTILGEESTKEIAATDDAQGFNQNLQAAKKGGKIAGDARKALEIETGKKVVSEDNFLPKIEQKPLLGE